jgi:hypothetical protein
VTDASSEGAAQPEVNGGADGAAEAKPVHRGRRRIRTILATLLIVVASILAPLAGITVFVRNQLLNTNRYISNIAPLTQNPAIVSAMSTEVTNALFTKVDVQQKIKGALPQKVGFVAVPITNALKTETYNVTQKFIASPQFEKIWLGMQRRVHNALVKVLLGGNAGNNSAVSSSNGKIVLNLQELAVNVIHELDQRGVHVFDKVPTSSLNPQIVLLHSKGLQGAQKVTRALNHLALFLPILFIVLYLLAIAISPRRRRAVMWCGVGLAIAMAVLGIILGLARSYLVSAAGNQLSPTAAGDLFDTVLRYVKTGLRISFAVGVVVALIAWLTGPSRPAVATRRGLARAWHWVRHDFARAGGWLEHNGGVVQGLLVGIGALLLIVLTPGFWWSLVIVVVTAVLVIAVRWSTRGKAPPPAAPTPVASGVS